MALHVACASQWPIVGIERPWEVRFDAARTLLDAPDTVRVNQIEKNTVQSI